MKKLFFLCITIVLIGGLSAAFAEEKSPHIGDKIASYLKDKGISEDIIVVIISTLPIVELRGAIPVANNLLGMHPLKTYVLAVVGNMIPVIPILLLIGPISVWAMRFKLGKRFFEWLFKRTRKKSASIEKYETLGLAIFVAIPLPITGAWTGCVAAFLMGTSLKHSFLAILLGVLIAGVVMTIVSVLGWIGAIIAGAALISLAVAALLKVLKKEQQTEPAVAIE